jgi:uncharacterized protein YecT (DUF1311 family)
VNARRIVAIGLLCGSATAFVASAHEPRYSNAFDSCSTRANGVTADLIDCIGAENARQGKRLNVAYQRASRVLPAPRRPALKAAQRAWVTYRDAACAFELDSDGGSIARIVANNCVLRMTYERADALEAIVRDAADR